MSNDHCYPTQSNPPHHSRHSALRTSCSHNVDLPPSAMEPRIFSPPSPNDTLTNSSSHAISLSLSADSFRPLLPSHDLSDPASFDAYIAEMLAKETKLPTPISSPTAVSTPISSERSSLDSMEETRIDDSPSQATITPAAVREAATKLKKKRSLGRALKSLKSSSRDLTDSIRGSKRVPFPLQLEETSSMTVGSENLPGAHGVKMPEDDEAFEDRNRTVRRRNMPHHPFRSEDVPYMQAYNQILLENDYQTHQLLCKLKPADSPTFHKFGKKPPADVLDLGCGEGFWVLHAAKLWKSNGTKVTGLDIIDVHNNEAGEVRPPAEPVHTPKNVSWVRANFVKFALPFPDNSFDLVRMANLTLCVPTKRWKFVLTEVRRVLRAGGRLELIDDDLIFPAFVPRASREVPRSPTKRHFQRTASDHSHSSLARSVSASPRSVSNKPLPEVPSPERKTGHKRSGSEVDFSTNSAIATHLETLFENMLSYRFGISVHPHIFLEKLLREVFGTDCARQTQKLELVIPSRDLSESSESIGLGLNLGMGSSAPSSYHKHGHSRRSSEDEKYKPSWMSHEWDKDKKRTDPIPIPIPSPLHVAFPPPSPSSFTSRSTRSSEDSTLDLSLDPQLMSSLTPKARQLLFGEGENMHRTPSWRSTGPYQPPGLVLLPSTLIPFTPLELEMHACKHMHTLLGCKYALSKYLATRKGKDGEPLLTDKELEEFLWDYECFRRKRFNWPQDVAGLHMDDEPEEPTSAHSHKSNIFNKLATVSSTPPSSEPLRSMSGSSGASVYGGVTVNRRSSTHVRTIRVYEAMKAHHHCDCHHTCGSC